MLTSESDDKKDNNDDAEDKEADDEHEWEKFMTNFTQKCNQGEKHLYIRCFWYLGNTLNYRCLYQIISKYIITNHK